MIYKDFQDLKLSALGMGCMRLPLTSENDSDVDEVQVAEMVEYSMKSGVNYYDTAWGYHNGNSELAMGRALKKYPRESFYLATKFPGYDAANMTKVEEIFEKQLEKLQVEYFDFYLFHNVCEKNIDGYLDPANGIHDYLMKQKENGRIKHLGFSCHGTYETMMRFLEAYGDTMEFCQIQLNYIDYDFQKAKDKIEELRKRNIPVWVMEPLRGGKLCNVNDETKAKLAGINPDKTPTDLAFRFLQAIPEVTMILSGMSNLEQMKQNIETFATDEPVSAADFANMREIGLSMVGKKILPCTACRYCTSKCPMELNIPWLIELYNEHSASEGGFIAPFGVSSLPEDKRPSACIGCRSCEAVCPQSIKISEAMADFAEMLK
ncbi:MAG: 4Fe-4S dicluster domain-containing protein [Clostridiales bacterium]|nr:4Fe-4S dicluster domain-containing protein [Clostridiales bacterium]